MQTDDELPKEPFTYYGKKIYYVTPLLIAKKAIPIQSTPKYWYEDIEEDKDK